MTGKDLHDAIAFVGPDLIDIAETTHFSSSPWKSLLVIAASAVIILGLGKADLRQLPVSIPETPQQTSTAEIPHIPEETIENIPASDSIPSEETFYTMFPKIDRNSMDACLQAHPELLDNGWDRISINEAGFQDHGTEIRTTRGDPVLALDAENQIILIRVSGETYQGVLAISGNAQQLRLAPSSQMGYGETVAAIAAANNGILAMNGSCFADEDGQGNGGQLFGYAMCNGISYNEKQHLSEGYHRLEIDAEGQFHLAGTQEPIGDTVMHAVEFGPALLKNRKILVDESCGFTGTHPRSAIGQGQNGEIMMLVIEGRMPGYSDGTNVIECAELLAAYGCQTAMNIDGGTSSVLWYDGEYVTRCSNSGLPEGRLLPNAFVLQEE